VLAPEGGIKTNALAYLRIMRAQPPPIAAATAI